MKTKRNEKITYIDTFSWLNLTEEDYLEWLRDNDDEKTIEDIRESDYNKWLMNERENEIDDFFANLKWTPYNDCSVVVTGTLGLWNGKHTIYAKRFNSKNYTNNFYDKKWRYENPAICQAIRACIGNCDDFEVKMENGVVEVIGHHHDGTNCFEIHCVSKKGEKPTENFDGYDEREIKDCWFKKFTEYLF